MGILAIDFYIQERNTLINRTIRTYWNIFQQLKSAEEMQNVNLGKYQYVLCR